MSLEPALEVRGNIFARSKKKTIGKKYKCVILSFDLIVRLANLQIILHGC